MVDLDVAEGEEWVANNSYVPGINNPMIPANRDFLEKKGYITAG